jgi:hypothetical protein
MTGATGRRAVERFYADQLLPHLPKDLDLRRISRTVDRWRLVDETTVSFTHDRTRIRSQRVLCDQASPAAQLGLGTATAPAATGPAR